MRSLLSAGCSLDELALRAGEHESGRPAGCPQRRVPELVDKVRNNGTIDWLRENVRAKLRVLVKRTLRQHGHPPDKKAKATKTVLAQAEHLSATWATAA